MHIVFETPRLILRQFTEDDARLIFELNSEPEVVKFIHEPVMTSQEQAVKVITDSILPQYKNNLGGGQPIQRITWNLSVGVV